MGLRETIEGLLAAERSYREPGHEAIVETWRREANSLLDAVEGWIAPHAAAGLIQARRTGIMVCEHGLDPYPSSGLELGVGNLLVRLEPRGALVVGARGRIDMSVDDVPGIPFAMLLLRDGDGLEGAHPGAWTVMWSDERTSFARPALPRLDRPAFEAVLDRLLTSALFEPAEHA